MKKEKTICLFGEILVSARSARGISQYELSKKSGISERYLNFLEHGTYEPGAAMLIKLGHALDMRPGELLDAYDEKIKTEQKQNNTKRREYE